MRPKKKKSRVKVTYSDPTRGSWSLYSVPSFGLHGSPSYELLLRRIKLYITVGQVFYFTWGLDPLIQVETKSFTYKRSKILTVTLSTHIVYLSQNSNGWFYLRSPVCFPVGQGYVDKVFDKNVKLFFGCLWMDTEILIQNGPLTTMK